MLVDSFPFLGQILRLHHRVHDFPGELLPPELSIEGLDKSVPYWFSHRYQVASVTGSSLMTSMSDCPVLSIFGPAGLWR